MLIKEHFTDNKITIEKKRGNIMKTNSKINGTLYYTTLDTIGIECLEHCFQTLYNDSKEEYFDGNEDLYGLMEEYLEKQGTTEDVNTKINEIASSLTREQYRYLKELYYNLFESQK